MFSQSNFRNYSMKCGSRGEVYCCMDRLVPVSHSLQRRAPQSVRELSSQSPPLTWSPSGWVSPKDLSNNSLTWQESVSPPSSSLMRSIPFADSVVRERMTQPGESRLSSSFKCKVSVTAWTACSSSAPPTSPGSSIKP